MQDTTKLKQTDNNCSLEVIGACQALLFARALIYCRSPSKLRHALSSSLYQSWMSKFWQVKTKFEQNELRLPARSYGFMQQEWSKPSRSLKMCTYCTDDIIQCLKAAKSRSIVRFQTANCSDPVFMCVIPVDPTELWYTVSSSLYRYCISLPCTARPALMVSCRKSYQSLPEAWSCARTALVTFSTPSIQPSHVRLCPFQSDNRQNGHYCVW